MLTTTTAAKIRFKIDGMPTDRVYNAMPFGRQMEFRCILSHFKSRAKSVHVSQKRRTFASALKEAISLYGATEFYCVSHDSANYRDDSFEFFYVSGN